MEAPVAEPPAAPSGSRLAPEIVPAQVAARLPETVRYRLKNRILGPPIATERQSVERLGRPTALAVLSSDVISSSAYATEQILFVLVRAVGIAAFSLVMPITFAVIAVLIFVTLSYLEVVKVYTKAGGAYVVSRENFGPKVAQVAVMSLLIDYTLTVAVSVAAGVAALTSVFPVLTRDNGTVWISAGLVILIAYINLRGVREAGRVFALPTYFFVANMVILIGFGAVRAISGTLRVHSLAGHPGAVEIGHPGSGLLLGASLFVVMRAFASGGSALTGTEAISNGVSVFRKPEARNARITMLWMSTILGSLVLGIGALAAVVHPVPYLNGTPTVVSQIAKYVYGTGALGGTLYVLLQAATMLILVLAANTSFTGFPYLASFAAEDSYLPRQLMKRGHRLVFSSGIIVLTGASVVLLVVTRAQVDKLIPLYAIGVFTGFTMAGLGMAKYHVTHKEGGWKRRFAINGTAGVLSGIVDIIIAVSKFGEGAWVVVILLPVGVVALLLLHRQYSTEQTELEEGALDACEVPVLRRHAVIVLIDRLDLATARAIRLREDAHPRHAADRALRRRPERAGGLGTRVASVGSVPPASRHNRVPGPAVGPRLARACSRSGRRRPDRSDDPASEERVHWWVAPAFARPQCGPHRGGGQHPRPRERDNRSVPDGRKPRTVHMGREDARPETHNACGRTVPTQRGLAQAREGQGPYRERRGRDARYGGHHAYRRRAVAPARQGGGQGPLGESAYTYGHSQP